MRYALRLLVCAIGAGVALASCGTGPPRQARGPLLFNGAQLGVWLLNQSAQPSRVQVVRDPDGARDTVLRFTTYNRDVAPLTPTKNPRSQLTTPTGIVKSGHAFWESFEVYLPRDFPMVETDHGWLSLNTPFYGRPFAGTPSTGLSIVDGYFRWQSNGHALFPWQVYWQMPATVGRWLRFTWRIDPEPVGFAELYYDGAAVGASDHGHLWHGVQLPVIDRSDWRGPWSSALQVYFKHGQFRKVVVYFRGFRIATTQAVAQAGAA